MGEQLFLSDKTWHAAFVNYSLFYSRSANASRKQKAFLAAATTTWTCPALDAAVASGAFKSHRAIYDLYLSVVSSFRSKKSKFASSKYAAEEAALEAFLSSVPGVGLRKTELLWECVARLFSLKHDGRPLMPVAGNMVLKTKNSLTRLENLLAQASATGPDPPAGSAKRAELSSETLSYYRRLRLEVPEISLEKLPIVIALVLAANSNEPIDQIMARVPSSSALRTADVMFVDKEERDLKAEVNGATVHLSTDGANRGKDYMFSTASFWSESKGVPVYRSLDVAASSKAGADIALAVENLMAEYKLKEIVTLAADNAPNMAKTLMRGLQASHPHLQFVGCDLHVLNLMLADAIAKAFGEPKMGIPSAVQAVYVLYALQEADWTMFKAHAAHVLGEDKAKDLFSSKMVEPLATRWWTLAVGLDYALDRLDAIIQLAIYMADGVQASSKYLPMWQELAVWLSSPAILAQAHFLRGYCTSFWGPEMVWSQAPMFDGWPAGFRAPQMPSRIAGRRLALAALDSNWRNDIAFADVAPEMEKMCAEDCALFLGRTDQFFKCAISKMDHSASWEASMAYCALAADADEARKCARKLVAEPALRPKNMPDAVWAGVVNLCHSGGVIDPALAHFLQTHVLCRPTTTHRVEGFVSLFASLRHNRPRISDFRLAGQHKGLVNIVQQSRLDNAAAVTMGDAEGGGKVGEGGGKGGEGGGRGGEGGGKGGEGGGKSGGRKSAKFRSTKKSISAILKSAVSAAGHTEVSIEDKHAARRNISTPTAFEKSRQQREVQKVVNLHDKRVAGKTRGNRKHMSRDVASASAALRVYAAAAEAHGTLKGDAKEDGVAETGELGTIVNIVDNKDVGDESVTVLKRGPKKMKIRR